MTGLSVIICTYNGASRLENTLRSIVKQKADFPWELILVDNASTDSTQQVCIDFLTEHGKGISWKIVEESKPGLIYARLCGMRASRYDVLMYCDDDNSLCDDYLQMGGTIMQQQERIGALGGCGIAEFEGTKPEWFDRYYHSFAVGTQADQDGKLKEYPAEVYGAGTFLRKEPLTHFFYNGFQTVLSGRTGNKLVSGDDVEWCYLLQLAGYEIWYDHRLTFLHLMPEGRMQWSYYLRLKQAIAAGSGRLIAYTCLFQNMKAGLIDLLLLWLKKTIRVTAIYLKNKLSNVSGKVKKHPEAELGALILEARMKSYWTSLPLTLRHFRQLKSFI